MGAVQRNSGAPCNQSGYACLGNAALRRFLADVLIEANESGIIVETCRDCGLVFGRAPYV